MGYAIEVNLYRYVPLKHLLNQMSFTEAHSTLILSFFLVSALKEYLFTILDGLCMSLGLYRKITNVCLGFPDVILYPISCLLDMARRRVDNRHYLTCIIHSKPGLSSFLPVTHFVLCCLPFLCFYGFIFTVFHWAPLFDQTSVKPLFIIFWGSRNAASLPMLAKSVVFWVFF